MLHHQLFWWWTRNAAKREKRSLDTSFDHRRRLLLFVAFYPIDRPKDYISGKRYEAQKIINKRRDSNGLFIANAPTEQNAKVDYKRPDAPTAHIVLSSL